MNAPQPSSYGVESDYTAQTEQAGARTSVPVKPLVAIVLGILMLIFPSWAYIFVAMYFIAVGISEIARISSHSLDQ